MNPLRMIYRGLVWFANSPRTLFLGYLAMLAVGGGLYSRFESKGFADSLWWAVVTASTVGYGDTYPTTVPGRIVAGLLISTMVLAVIPLITAHFASRLIVDADAFKHDEQEEIKTNLRAILDKLTEKDTSTPSPVPSARPGTR